MFGVVLLAVLFQNSVGGGFFFKVYFSFNYVSLCGHVFMSAGALPCQKKVSDPLKLDLAAGY